MAGDKHLEIKSILNVDFERKKELDRRKKLRLIQVRQQSKDFAKTLRESIKAEEINQKLKFFECRKKQLHQHQVEELLRLQDLYKTCLQTIGRSHREAANQPNVNLIKEEEKIQRLAQASERGAEAFREQKQSLAVQRQKIEAPIIKKQTTRNKENFRSFFVSSLPKPIFGSRKQPM